MKRTGLTLLIIGALSVGCEKLNQEKTCECTTVYSDPSYANQVNQVETSQDCSYYDDSFVSGGLSAVKTCEEI